jgi:hypothetical protein
MEILIILAALVAIGAIWYFNRGQKMDANNDGKVNLADVGAFIDNTAKGVARVADANKDGKVNTKDAKAVIKKAAVKAKSTAKRVTTAAKRAPAKKK